MKVGYGVCVGSWGKFAANVAPRVGNAPLIAMWGQTSIADAYSSIMDAYEDSDLDMLILQHDDLEITDPDAIDKFAAAFAADDSVAALGAAGGMVGCGLAWWNCSPVGHVLSDQGMVDFGQRSGRVELLEGSLLVLSGWAVRRNLGAWDRPGFHGYDCDISMRARATGHTVAVVDVEVHHHTTLGFKGEASHLDWLDANQQFREIWGA